MSTTNLGTLKLFAGSFTPKNWFHCSGQQIPISDYPALHQLIGNTFGGDNINYFALPNMKGTNAFPRVGRAPLHIGQGKGLKYNYNLGQLCGTAFVSLSLSEMPVHSHIFNVSDEPGDNVNPSENVFSTYENSSKKHFVKCYIESNYVESFNKPSTVSISEVGSNKPHLNMQPFTSMNYIIPSMVSNDKSCNDTPNQMLGEVRAFAFGKIPEGWLPCDGRSLEISQYTSLFSILSTYYGGDGRQSFNLPDLRERVPVQASPLIISSGENEVYLKTNEMPSHSHGLVIAKVRSDCIEKKHCKAASNDCFTLPFRDKYLFAGKENICYKLNSKTLSSVGSNKPHENRQPYLALNFCIATEGYYPHRD